MKTLIIVDTQNDFMPDGALGVPGGDEIIPVVNKVQEKFDLIIATQDWHPREHISFASNHDDKKPFDTIEWHGMEQILWPDHCVQNSEGAKFHPDLKLKKGEAIIRKGMNPEIDSYSGFYDNGHEKSTGLAGYLREREAKELYFCGLAADICVHYSMMDALNEGFSVTLIEDATRPINEDDFVKAKEKLRKRGGKIVESMDL